MGFAGASDRPSPTTSLKSGKPVRRGPLFGGRQVLKSGNALVLHMIQTYQTPLSLPLSVQLPYNTGTTVLYCMSYNKVT